MGASPSGAGTILATHLLSTACTPRRGNLGRTKEDEAASFEVASAFYEARELANELTLLADSEQLIVRREAARVVDVEWIVVLIGEGAARANLEGFLEVHDNRARCRTKSR
jgi:hypothetical protein